MAAAYKLKLLSGALDGVEFSLLPGDTVFCVGRARELNEGGLGTTLAQADNVFYIPDDRIEAVFLLRCMEEGGAPELRERAEGGWVPSPLPINTVLHIAGLMMAVRREEEAWSAEVVDHRLPVIVPQNASTAAAGNGGAAAVWRNWRWWPVAAMVVLLGCGGGWLLYERQQPAAQVRTLESTLARSPYQYTVVAGRDGSVYAFSESAEAVAWGQRASLRAGRANDVYLQLHQETARLGELLDRAGLVYAVIRLSIPDRPEVVLMSGADDVGRRKRAGDLLASNMPYAESVRVRLISDAQLLSIAQSELHARGISTRVEPGGGRASLVNDVFLDDAALYSMARYRDEFVRTWGDRRIGIRIRLWDDLLQGRSYKYSRDQLLSVGEGRWEFANGSSR